MTEEFHTRLRTLANTCEFRDVKQEIMTQILHGCLSSHLRRKGLMTNLPLDQLLAEARSYEIKSVTVGVNKVTQFRRGCGHHIVVVQTEAVPVMDPPAEISLVMVAVVVTTTAEVVVVFHTVNLLIGVDFQIMVPRILAVIVVVPSHTSLPVLPKGNSADRARKLDILLESVN